MILGALCGRSVTHASGLRGLHLCTYGLVWLQTKRRDFARTHSSAHFLPFKKGVHMKEFLGVVLTHSSLPQPETVRYIDASRCAHIVFICCCVGGHFPLCFSPPLRVPRVACVSYSMIRLLARERGYEKRVTSRQHVTQRPTKTRKSVRALRWSASMLSSPWYRDLRPSRNATLSRGEVGQ